MISLLHEWIHFHNQNDLLDISSVIPFDFDFFFNIKNQILELNFEQVKIWILTLPHEQVSLIFF